MFAVTWTDVSGIAVTVSIISAGALWLLHWVRRQIVEVVEDTLGQLKAHMRTEEVKDRRLASIDGIEARFDRLEALLVPNEIALKREERETGMTST